MEARLLFSTNRYTMKNKHVLNIALIASMGLAAAPVFSTTSDGSLGGTSEGNVDVLLNLGKMIQISSLTDIDFTTVAPNADAQASDLFCVYSNTSVGTYKITSTSTEGSGSDFALKHAGSTATLPYTLTMDDGSGQKSLVSGTESTDSFAADGSAFDCGGSTNATLEATVLGADLASRPSGSYSDTLVLVVTPD